MRYLMLVPMLVVSTAAAGKEQETRSTQVEPDRNGPSVELSSGIDYEEGDYGTGEKVQILTVPNTVRVTTGRLQVSATLPYKRIEGPGNVVSGGGILGLPIIIDPTVPPAGRNVREGLGDLTVAASYAIPTRVVDVALSGGVKLPTASKGMGTGETDFEVGAEMSKDLGGVTPFAGVSYTIPGEPEDFSLQNSLSFRGGIAVPVAPRARGYVSYTYAESLSGEIENKQSITGGINAAIGDRLRLGVFGEAGLSEGSPDIGAGLRLGVRIK
jgi:hypothetical protein